MFKKILKKIKTPYKNSAQESLTVAHLLKLQLKNCYEFKNHTQTQTLSGVYTIRLHVKNSKKKVLQKTHQIRRFQDLEQLYGKHKKSFSLSPKFGYQPIEWYVNLEEQTLSKQIEPGSIASSSLNQKILANQKSNSKNQIT